MAFATVRLADITGTNGRKLVGPKARDELGTRLNSEFNIRKANAYDPLKVVIDFADIDDLGVSLVQELAQKIAEVYEASDISWYVQFNNIEEKSAMYTVLNLLIKDCAASGTHPSIVCQSGSSTFLCGVTQRDLMNNSSDHVTSPMDWSDCTVILDYLYNLGEGMFACTRDVHKNIRDDRKLALKKVHAVLQELDLRGMVVRRASEGSSKHEYAHVARYSRPT